MDHDKYQDSCHEVGNTGFAGDEDAIPHTLDPLPAQHSEDDHETETHKCDENEENPDKDIADKIDVDDDCNGAKPTYA